MKSEAVPSGNIREWIYVYFSYRNVGHFLTIYGRESDLTIDFAFDVVGGAC